MNFREEKTPLKVDSQNITLHPQEELQDFFPMIKSLFHHSGNNWMEKADKGDKGRNILSSGSPLKLQPFPDCDIKKTN